MVMRATRRSFSGFAAIGGPAVFGLALALAGCGQEPQAPTLDSTEVAGRLKTVALNPGQWEASQTIVDVQVIGLPDNAQPDAIKKMAGTKTQYDFCMTPEQAASPAGEVLSAQQGAECKYSKLDMTNGRIAATMVCSGGVLPGAMNVNVGGTYLPESYRNDVNVVTEKLPNGLTINLKMLSSGRRLGDCPATGTKG